ncbi:MAG: HNH endonuclease [bacterium]|nr:HNH endonuclease [bacterium]
MLVEKLHKLGAVRTDRAELLLDALAALVESHEGPRGPSQPVQIHVHDQGERMTIDGRELGRTDAEHLKCDAVVCKPGERAKATIPPRGRREVLARDRHRCQSPGCSHTRFLEIHHKIPRANGGTNEPGNLVTLCAACHRLHHRKGALVREPAAAYLAGPSRSGIPGRGWNRVCCSSIAGTAQRSETHPEARAAC